MRIVLIAILLSNTIMSAGQADFRLDSTIQSIDSLYQLLSNVSNMVRQHEKSIVVSPEKYSYQIKEFRSDSSVIQFFDASEKLLFRTLNKYNEKGCRYWNTKEVYDSTQKLIYWVADKWSCLKSSEKIDPEVKYFDALEYEKGRFIYDSLGRVKEKIWWNAAFGNVRKYTFTYDENNNQTYILTKLDTDLFWK